jgi:hypothetical protein
MMRDNEERLWQLTVSIAAAMAGNPAGLVAEDAKTAVCFAGHVFTEYMDATRQKPVKIKPDEIEKLRRAFK